MGKAIFALVGTAVLGALIVVIWRVHRAIMIAHRMRTYGWDREQAAWDYDNAPRSPD